VKCAVGILSGALPDTRHVSGPPGDILHPVWRVVGEKGEGMTEEEKSEIADLLETIAFKFPMCGMNPQNHHKCEWCRILIRIENILRRIK
jgi:hypothetical protein